jgi:uncharacterized protein (DUF362 family)
MTAMDRIDRRRFLCGIARGAASAAALGVLPVIGVGCGGDDRASRSVARHAELASLVDRLAIARNADARVATLAALDRLGGARTFVKSGDRVVLKPNMAWARRPELAANTNPHVVGALTGAFLAAGASEVVAFDRTCPPRGAATAYRLSGIPKAIEAAGGRVIEVPERPSRFRDVTFPGFESLPEGRRFPGGTWPIFEAALDADLLVNVPVAKHHTVAGVTLGMKNLMGVMGGDRGHVHTYIQEAIALLNVGVQPHLTVLDASRMLVANGPTGGKLEDVVAAHTIVAGVDPVAVDAWAVHQLPWRQPPVWAKLAFLDLGGRLGVGEPDLSLKTILEA